MSSCLFGIKGSEHTESQPRNKADIYLIEAIHNILKITLVIWCRSIPLKLHPFRNHHSLLKGLLKAPLIAFLNMVQFDCLPSISRNLPSSLRISILEKERLGL